MLACDKLSVLLPSLTMESMTLEEHKTLLEKLLETVNCPVCFNILQPSVSQCVNGHGICGDCRAKVSQCPTCRENFSPFKNTLLNQVLELFPHECNFKGCQEFVKSKDDHKKWCGYRQTKCKFCQWTGYGKDILDHIKQKHSQLVILGEENERRSWKNFYPDEQSCCVHTPIFAHGQFFWMNMVNNVTEMSFTKIFSLVPNGKIDCTFEMKFVLKNSKNLYIASTFLSPDTVLNPSKKDNTFTLHSTILQDFFDEDNQLLYNLYVNKLSKLN